jgi:hypothetical protein
MLANVHGVDLGALLADMEAQERGYTSAEAERRILYNANSSRFARKAARRRRRQDKADEKPNPGSGNWTIEQFQRGRENSEDADLRQAMRELGIS